jgi:N6-adenosine-specific RNA methylase IME4
MDLDAIRAVSVAQFAAADAHLYLWTTNRFLRHVWSIAEAWGFQGVCVLTWCKPYRGGLGGGAWQSNTEFCLFARRGLLAANGKAELPAIRPRAQRTSTVGDDVPPGGSRLWHPVLELAGRNDG